MSERVVSGSVAATGEVLQGDGFHVVRKAEGEYLILFRPPFLSLSTDKIDLIPARDVPATGVLVSADGLHALVAFRDGAQRRVDCAFSFSFCGKAHPQTEGNAPGAALDDASLPASLKNGQSVVRLLDRQTATSVPEDVLPQTSQDPAASAQQLQIQQLQALMHQVLEPLHLENKMLRSRLDLLKQHHGQAPPPASDLLPVTLGLPGAHAVAKLLTAYEFETVLDFGFGWQERCDALLKTGRTVSTLLAPDAEASEAPAGLSVRRGTIHSALLPTTFDCIIAANVLHRERDPQRFLRRLHDLLPERSVLAITVPALRYPMLHGELSIWSPGLLLYHLVLAGFDCSNIRCLTQGEEISVILEKDSIEPWEKETLPPLAGLRRFLPQAIGFVQEPACFNGDIPELNW